MRPSIARRLTPAASSCVRATTPHWRAASSATTWSGERGAVLPPQRWPKRASLTMPASWRSGRYGSPRKRDNCAERLLRLRRHVLEMPRHLVRARRRDQAVLQHHLVDVRRARRAERRERAVDVVVRAAHLRVGPEEEPERGRGALVGHADRPRVEHGPPVELERELVVRVAADDGPLGDAVEHRPQALGRRDLRDDLGVAARRPVAEEDRSEVVDRERDDRLERGEEVAVRAVDARRAPRGEPLEALGRVLGRAPRVERLDDLAIAVAHDEPRAVAERAQPVDRVGHERSRDGVAADDDRVDVEQVDLGEDGVEGREIAVDVAERRDPHEAGPDGPGGSGQTSSAVAGLERPPRGRSAGPARGRELHAGERGFAIAVTAGSAVTFTRSSCSGATVMTSRTSPTISPAEPSSPATTMIRDSSSASRGRRPSRAERSHTGRIVPRRLMTPRTQLTRLAIDRGSVYAMTSRTCPIASAYSSPPSTKTTACTGSGAFGAAFLRGRRAGAAKGGLLRRAGPLAGGRFAHARQRTAGRRRRPSRP